MRIMVTGADGLVGSNLIHYMIRKPGYQYDIHGWSKELDVTDYALVQRGIASINPSIVVHCAAYTAVDKAEDEPDKAFMVNAYGTENIAICCRRLDIPMVYLSTDAVFDGDKDTPYTEWDAPNPISVYGKSKYAGELAVQQHLNKFYIIRTNWVYGKGGRPNFITQAIKNVRKGEDVSVITQYSSPTYVVDLVKAIEALIQTWRYGIYHYTNSGIVSRREVVQHIQQYLEKPGTVWQYKEEPKAFRAVYCPFDLTKFTKTTGIVPPTWQESLEGFIND